MVLFSDPKPSYPAEVTTEKENWTVWAKAWWMWQQGEPSPHMVSTKAWHNCCSCTHHEGLLPLCHKWQGYFITSLSALSQLNCSGKERSCSACSVQCDMGRCHTHTLPACLEHQLTALNPHWLPVYLFIYFWKGGEGRRSGWLTHNWLNSATVKRVGVYWVYLVGMRACYIRRLYKEMVICAHNTQHAEKSILTHIWHTIGAQHTWLKSSNEARVQQKKLFWWEQSETLLPESQHKTIGHDSLLPTTMAVWSK